MCSEDWTGYKEEKKEKKQKSVTGLAHRAQQLKIPLTWGSGFH